MAGFEDMEVHQRAGAPSFYLEGDGIACPVNLAPRTLCL